MSERGTSKVLQERDFRTASDDEVAAELTRRGVSVRRRRRPVWPPLSTEAGHVIDWRVEGTDDQVRAAVARLKAGQR